MILSLITASSIAAIVLMHKFTPVVFFPQHSDMLAVQMVSLSIALGGIVALNPSLKPLEWDRYHVMSACLFCIFAGIMAYSVFHPMAVIVMSLAHLFLTSLVAITVGLFVTPFILFWRQIKPLSL